MAVGIQIGSNYDGTTQASRNNIKISNCNILLSNEDSSSAGNGIIFSNTKNSIIENCKITNSTIGIFLNYCNGVDIKNNSILYSG